MGAIAEMLRYLQLRDRQERLTRFLNDRRIDDLTSPDFALTPRTRRLRCWGDGGKLEAACPFVVIHAVPEAALERVWLLSDERVWNWLDPNQRRYSPWNGGYFLPPSRKPTSDGIIFEDGGREHGACLDNYVVVETGGVVEIGLAGDAAVIHEKQTGFNLLPIIGATWRLLRFVPEFYKQVAVASQFTVIVSIRKTQDSILGGLARGWNDP